MASAPAVEAPPQEPPATDVEKLGAGISSLEIQEDKVQEDVPPHRSHDPQYNQKRTDPFQFGSRYLGEDDDVFEFNAWDHVETDDAYKEYAEQQFEAQRKSPVSDFDKRKWRLHSLRRSASRLRRKKGLACVMIYFQCIVHLNLREDKFSTIIFRSHLTRSFLTLSLYNLTIQVSSTC